MSKLFRLGEIIPYLPLSLYIRADEKTFSSQKIEKKDRKKRLKKRLTKKTYQKKLTQKKINIEKKASTPSIDEPSFLRRLPINEAAHSCFGWQEAEFVIEFFFSRRRVQENIFVLFAFEKVVHNHLADAFAL